MHSQFKSISPGGPSAPMALSTGEMPPAYQDEAHGHMLYVPVEVKQEFTAAKAEIKKNGLSNVEARLAMALDVSGSMQNPNQFYEDEKKDCKVQRLINKALALSLLLDDDGSVELFPFGDICYQPIIINKHNYRDAVRLVFESSKGFKETTNYADPISAVREHFFDDKTLNKEKSPCEKPPVFVIFITDGEPNVKKDEAEDQIIASSFQAIHWHFICLEGKTVRHPDDEEPFAYLKAWDDMKSKRFVDNVDLQILKDPDDLTFSQLINEFRPWLIEAHKKGLLVKAPKLDKAVATTLHESKEGRMVGGLFDKASAAAPAVPDPTPAPKACCVIL